MATKIEAGIYEAKIIDYGIGQTKAGDPQVMILFEYNDNDGQRHELIWYGSLKEKAIPYTMKTLLYCGMNCNDPMELAEGIPSNILDAATPLKITVELEQKNDGTGTFAKIAWVNRASTGGLAKRITKSEAKIKMGALNLKGAMLVARQETGIQIQERSKTFDQMDDIGF